MLRAFFGIPIDKDTIRRLLQDIEPLKMTLGDQLRWIKTDLWHITIKFLAAVHPSDLAILAETAELFAEENGPFSLQITKIACFPRPWGRIVAAYIAANPQLHALLDELDEAGEKLGIKAEARRYRPHVTLAKFKAQNQPIEAMLYSEFQMPVNQVVLYQSKPSADGSHYIPLQHFALSENEF